VHEVVLLLGDVVGLQRRRGDLDGVGEDLLALLDLLGLVGDGLFFVFDLRNGVDRLRRIVDDAGTELRVRAGCNAAARPMASAVKISFFIALSFRLAVGVAMLLQQYRVTAVRQEFLLDLCKTVGLWLAPCVSFFLLGFEGRYLLRGQLLSGQHSDEPEVWIEAVLGIGRVFGVVLVLQLLHLCRFALTAGKGESRQEKRERATVRIESLLKTFAE
jgi:hypothetical protein